MTNNKAAVKTYKELRDLGVREANDYFQKFSEFLTGTKASFENIKPELFKTVDLDNGIGCVLDLLAKAETHGKRVMVIGNGGSAGIAMHTLADYANAGGLKTLDFYGPALLTCMSNDYGYENVFSKPIVMFAEAGDILFAISSSGKSPNIVAAAKKAKELNCAVVTFSGFDADNPLRKLGNINFYTPSTHYGFVELSHQTIIHCILDLFVRIKIYEQERELLG